MTNLTDYKIGDSFKLRGIEYIVEKDVDSPPCSFCALRTECANEEWTDTIHTNCGNSHYHYERKP